MYHSDYTSAKLSEGTRVNYAETSFRRRKSDETTSPQPESQEMTEGERRFRKFNTPIPAADAPESTAARSSRPRKRRKIDIDKGKGKELDEGGSENGSDKGRKKVIDPLQIDDDIRKRLEDTMNSIETNAIAALKIAGVYKHFTHLPKYCREQLFQEIGDANILIERIRKELVSDNPQISKAKEKKL